MDPIGYTVDQLNEWIRSTNPLTYSVKPIDFASANGQTDVLDWWYDSGLELKFSKNAIEKAIQGNMIDSLKWWFVKHRDDELFIKLDEIIKMDSVFIRMDSIFLFNLIGIEVLEFLSEFFYKKPYDNYLIECQLAHVCQSGNLDLMKWWSKYFQKNNKPFVISEYCVKNLIKWNHLNIIVWLLENVETFSLPATSIDIATRNNQIDMMNWLNKYMENNDCVFVITEDTIDAVSSNGHLEVLNWFYLRQDMFPIKYSTEAIDSASKNGHIEVLDWFYNHRDEFPMMYTTKALNSASVNGNLDIANWWLSRLDMLELKYTSEIIDLASWSDRIEILDLFYKYHDQIEFKYTSRAIDLASQLGNLEIIKWFWYRRDEIPFIYTTEAFEFDRWLKFEIRVPSYFDWIEENVDVKIFNLINQVFNFRSTSCNECTKQIEWRVCNTNLDDLRKDIYTEIINRISLVKEWWIENLDMDGKKIEILTA